MYINVDTENEDGSANCSVDLSHDEATQLINYAIVNLLEKGIREGKDLSVEKEEDEDEDDGDDGYAERFIVIRHLKDCLVSSYLSKFYHDEDIVHNLKVRRGCKALLRHYMIPALADKYIAQIERIHEGGEDE
jgi:hypothetical protein